MSKLPLLSWREVVKEEYIVPIPKHKEIKRGLLLEIISEAGLSREDFLKLLK